MQQDERQIEVAGDIPFRVARNEDGEDEQLTVDVYAPRDTTPGARAAILWLHGGGFRLKCDKRQGYIVTLCKAYAQKGYVSIASEYRRRREPSDDRAGTIADAVDDALCALEWVVAHAAEYRIDPECVYLAGGSAGGMLGTALLSGYAEHAAARPVPGTILAFVNLWGSPWPEYQPDGFGEAFPPTLLIHGTNDELVPYGNATRLRERLDDAGVRVELFTLEGAGHTAIGRKDEFVPQIDAFLAAL
jgi:acetyl esterase/lipase